MVVVQSKRKRLRTKFAKHEIPKSLIYEEYDGKPMYYRGYKEVMNGLKTHEEIMGESDTQFIIVACLLKFLIKNIDDDKFIVGSNEIGLHTKKRSNLSADIAIYEKSTLQGKTPKNKYFDIPPLVVIEVDIEADTNSFGISEIDYYSMKTKKLLDFGTKEVVCFFSGGKKMLVAHPNQDWVLSDWDKNVTLLGEYQFSLANLLQKDGFKL